MTMRNTRRQHRGGLRPMRRHHVHIVRGYDALRLAAGQRATLHVRGVETDDLRIASMAISLGFGDEVTTPRVRRPSDEVLSCYCPSCREQADAAKVASGKLFCDECGSSLCGPRYERIYPKRPPEYPEFILEAASLRWDCGRPDGPWSRALAAAKAA